MLLKGRIERRNVNEGPPWGPTTLGVNPKVGGAPKVGPNDIANLDFFPWFLKIFLKFKFNIEVMKGKKSERLGKKDFQMREGGNLLHKDLLSFSFFFGQQT